MNNNNSNNPFAAQTSYSNSFVKQAQVNNPFGSL